MKKKKILITVCLLTFNGEKYLEEVLLSIFHQETAFLFEVLVIDSGSTDQTMEILKKFPVKLVKVPNREFGHGKTRNLVAKLAQGDFIVYLVQDATPASVYWLERIISPFSNKEVVAVFGRHIPRKDSVPFIKRDIEKHFKSIYSGSKIYLQKLESKKVYSACEMGVLTFFSDVNSALRKSFLLKYPFENVKYAEDQAMGEMIIKNGFTKVYHPQASVFHSHKYPIWQYLLRYFDEYHGLKETIGFSDPVTIWRLIPQILKISFREAKYVVGLNKKIPFKIKWVSLAFFFVFSRRMAAYLVKKEACLPDFIKKRLSLEYRLKFRAVKE